MDLGLKGRSAIICASSRGLGKACAFSLASNGVNVVLNGRNKEVLEETASYISKSFSDIEVDIVSSDVSTDQGREALLEVCPAPDILINNNGGPPFKDFRDLDKESIMDGLNMNMITPIELIQKIIDGMIEKKFGRIVNITSISVKKPMFGLDLSSGARAGLTAFLSGVARSVAQHNVTINNILPGMFDTDRLRQSLDAKSKMTNESINKISDQMTSSVPAKRFGNPSEFGEACAFLCGEQAGYITGQNLLLDGGLYESSF